MNYPSKIIQFRAEQENVYYTLIIGNLISKMKKKKNYILKKTC